MFFRPFGYGLRAWAALLALACGWVSAAPVAPDPTFQTGAGPDNSVTVMAAGPDESLWIGGYFTKVDGQEREGVAKLGRDGALDPSFSPPSQLNSPSVLAPLPGGKLLVGGIYLGNFGTKFVYGILRLDAAGAYDPAFDASATTGSSSTSAIVPLPDGKILIGGSFTGGIARLLADGSRDPAFDPGTGPAGGSVSCLTVLPSGKILAGGSFASFAGQPRAKLCRLHPDGSLDLSFGSADSSPSSTVNAIAIQNDGRLLIGGSFTSVGGLPRKYVARLGADGLPEPDFRPEIDYGSVNSIIPLADGRVLIGGGFTKIDKINRKYVALLHADGSPDATFDTSTGAGSPVSSLLLQADGKIVVAGVFSTFGGVAAKYLTRLAAPTSETRAVAATISPDIAEAGTPLHLTGSNFTNLTGIDFPGGVAAVFTVLSETALDVTVPAGAVSGGLVLKSPYGDSLSSAPFHRLPGRPGEVDPAFDIGGGANWTVNVLTRDASGRVLAAGNFTTIGGVARSRIARLGPDGRVDPGFVPPDGSDAVYALAVQPDGKILAGGYRIGSGNPLARLDADGSLDPTFAAPGVGSFVSALALQADGKILAGGSFTRRLARLNSGGALDPTFDVGSGADSTVNAIEVLSDGRVLVAGNFSKFNGASSEGIVRLMPDGSRDPSFKVTGSGISGDVNAMAIQADGSILLGGTFYSVNGNYSLKYLARLGPDGAVDAGFIPAPDGYIQTLDIAPDGRIAVGGDFTSIAGSARDRVALLHADGAAVSEFSTLGGPSGTVRALLGEPDAGLIIGGNFGTVGGFQPSFLSRLYGDNGQTRPAIASFAPAVAAAGETVTLSGSNLAPLNSAEFAGGAVATVDPVSETSVRLTVPADAMSGPITLKNAYGQAVSPVIFRLRSQPVPTLDPIPAGTVSPGQVVTVTGKNFHDVTSVRLGVVAAAFTVVSATEMSFIVPETAVTGRVVLSGPGGSVQSATDLAVVKAPPVFTSAATAAGAVGVKFKFTLAATKSPFAFTAAPLPAGLSLDAASGVISGIPAAAGNFTVAISATNDGGTASGSMEIAIALPPAPVVASVTPAFVPAGGKILVSGSYLTLTTGVTIGGVPADFAVLADGKLSVTMPAGASGLVEIATTQGVASGPQTIAEWDFQGAAQIAGAGSDAAGEIQIPAGLTDAIAVSAGGYHSLALRADGSVTGWGGNWVGQAAPPANLAPAAAIAAGGFHSLALQADGTVAAWGRDDEGQCAGAADLENVAAIAAGSYHSLALRRNGTVAAWGLDANGRIDVPKSLGGVIAISAGGDFSLALKSDGTVVAWGDNSFGQTGVPAAAAGVVAISAGRTHAVALKSDGTVVCWGADWAGQCQPPAGLAGVVEISAGADHTAARLEDGSVVAWGANWSGQRTIPAGIADAISISAGGDHTLILRSPPAPTAAVPLVVTATPGQPLVFTPAAANGPFQFSAENLPAGLAIDAATGEIGGTPVRGGDSVVTLLARNSRGVLRRNIRFFAGPYILGWGTGLPGSTPAAPGNVVKVAAGGSHCLALRADGTVIGWGSNAYGQTTVPAGLANVVDIAAGVDFSLALKSDGTVIGWGNAAPYDVPPAVPPTYPPSWRNPVATGIVFIDARGDTAVGLNASGRARTIIAGSSYSESGGELVAAVSTTGFFSFEKIAALDRGGYLSGPRYASQVTAAGFTALAAMETEPYPHATTPSILAIRGAGELYEIQPNEPYSGASIIPRTETSNAVELAGGQQFGLVRNADGTALPIALSVNPQTSWNIPAAPFPSRETLVDVSAIAANARYALAVKSPAATPDIVSPRVLTARKNQPFAHQLAAAAGPVTWSAALLPAGLSLNSATEKISGAPSSSGVFNFLVIARGAGTLQTQVVSLKTTDGAAPVELTLDPAAVAENLPAGTPVGTLATIDFSPSDTFTYALVSGPGSADNPKFKISGNQLQTNALLDFETLPTASVRIRVTDSGANSFEKVFQIQIAGVDTDDDDLDGLAQAQETTLGADPLRPDTDGDGASDGQEVAAGTDPLSPASRPANYVACWGSNNYGQCSVPVDLGPVIAVAAGTYHTLALRADGTVAAWGLNSQQQCDVPASLSGVVALAASGSASFALKADGTVVSWGSSVLTATPAGLTDVVEISACGEQVAALRSYGQVVVWGSGYTGLNEVPAAAAGAAQVVVGQDFILTLNRDGHIVGWGGSYPGSQLLGPQGRSGYVALAAGTSLSLGLDAAGNVTAWGSGAYGANSVPAFPGPVRALAAGYYFGLALQTDGHVFAWGNNSNHQTEVPPSPGPVRAVAAGNSHAVALVGSEPAPQFLTASVTAITGLPMVRQLAFSGNADRFRADSLPPGISFDTATATLSGVPQTDGTFLLRVTAETGFERVTRIVPLHFQSPRNFGEWAAARFPAGDPRENPLADPDGDGTPNLIEYATHRDPLATDPAPPATVSLVSAGGQNHLALTYERLANATDIRCIVEVSGDLMQWSSATTTISILPHGETETVTVRDNAPATPAPRFIRLRVEK